MYAFLGWGASIALCGVDLLLAGALYEAAAVLCVGEFVAVGSHYMGILVVPLVAALLAHAWLRKRVRSATPSQATLATVLGALLWFPWVLRWVPEQLATSWGYPSRGSARDLFELRVAPVLDRAEHRADEAGAPACT
jgi:hypothetical protein